MSASTEAQIIHQRKCLIFLPQHSLDHIYNALPSFGNPMKLIWQSELSRASPGHLELDHLPCGEERLRAVAAPSCSKGWLWGHLTASLQGLEGSYQGNGARLFAAVPGGRWIMGINWGTRCSGCIWKAMFSPWRQSSSGTGSSGRLCNLHPWRLNWTLPQQELDKRTLQVHSHKK